MGVRAIQSAKDERENNGTAGQSTQNQEHVICQILMVTLINYVFQDVLIPPFPSLIHLVLLFLYLLHLNHH